MSEEIISGIVYTELNEELGPNPNLWYPNNLSEKIRMSVGIKSITLLSSDEGVVPQSLVIIPFPSFNLKGIIKYIERSDDSRKGGIVVSTITVLFEEANDGIFYRYIDYLEDPFSEFAQKVIDLETKEALSDEIFSQMNILRLKISEVLYDLYHKEKDYLKSEAFPEEEIRKEAEKLEGFNAKVVVCGDPAVGKTSTILTFTDNAFIRTYIPTLGVNLSEKTLMVKNKKLNLILWDIAGQTKYKLMRKHFYKGAEAVILVFDLTKSNTFESISNWFKDIKNNCGSGTEIIGILFGNKEDLKDARQVNRNDAEKIANELNLKYFEISALTGTNIKKAFKYLAEEVIKSKVN